ncbi:hypothetical protein EV424DRAFT_1541159 [Suillus variegatus]|nr:hypothetical protein EV424DRAFT_1541159 [Suillus variegatus]
MKSASLFFCNMTALAEPIITKRSDPLDIDVSSHQDTWKFKGVAFAYIRVTEGTIYINPDFSSKYAGTTNVGLIRSGHHFARPDLSTGATQASYL